LTATATSFPFSKHTGVGDTAPAFSGLCVYLQFTWEVGLPPFLWSFPPTATFTSFPAPGCWACVAPPAFSSRLVVRDFPFLLFGAQGTAPSLHMSFLLLLLIIQGFFLSFFPGWGSVWAMLICPGLSVGILRPT
jgi:hypothetical protein